MAVDEDKNKDKDTENHGSGTEGGVSAQQVVGTGGEQGVQTVQEGQVDAGTAGQTESTGKAVGDTAVDGRLNVPLSGGSAPRFQLPRLNLGANLPTIGSLAPKDWTGNLDFSDKEKTKAAAIRSNWEADIAKRDAVDAALTQKEQGYKDLTFQEAMRKGGMSPAEYVQMTAKRAKAEGRELNPYELALQASYWRDEKTPEQRKKEERNERLGLLFDNLGSLAANAIDTGMSFKGGMPVKASSEAANKRAEQIEAQRKAAQERMDTALLNARLAMAKTKEEREKLMAKLAASAQEKYLDRESRAAIAAANRQSSEAIARENRQSKEKTEAANRQSKAEIAKADREAKAEIARAELANHNRHPTVRKGYVYNGLGNGATPVELDKDYDLNNDYDVILLYNKLRKSDDSMEDYFGTGYDPNKGNAKERIGIARNRIMNLLNGSGQLDATNYHYASPQQRRDILYPPSGKDNDGSEVYDN